MSEPHTIPPHEPLNSENDPTGRWRIAELEALVNANTDHMTEVGVELCRERDARISELEAESADLRGLLLVIGSSHPHLVPHIDTYLKARAKGGSGTLYPRSG